MITCLAGLLLVLGSAVAKDRAIHHVHLAEIRSGVCYYRGHELRPPYRVVATYRLEPDTTWLAFYVNRLPVEDRTVLFDSAAVWQNRIEEQQARMDTVSEFGRHSLFTRDLARCVRFHVHGAERDPGLEPELARIVAASNRRGFLVDSVRVISDRVAVILRRGWPPEFLEIGVGPTLAPEQLARQRRRAIRDEASSLVRNLVMDRAVVIFESGIRTTGPRESIERRVQAIRRDPAVSLASVEEVEFRSPVPLSTFRRGPR